jgi:hypothetical protein
LWLTGKESRIIKRVIFDGTPIQFRTACWQSKYQADTKG